jgi:transposase
MQKALELMNVKLTEVVSDITGLTGLTIIQAILGGEHDPQELAKHRHERCHRTEAEIARALYGTWRAEHLFALQQALTLYQAYQGELRRCDEQIAAHLGTFTDRGGGQRLPPKPRRRKRRTNEPTFDARSALYRLSGADLTVIEGIEESTALMILSEIGIDMSKWPTDKHFVSWLGLCPQRHSSAGKQRDRRRRPRNRASHAFRLAAQGCHHAKSALGAFYRRIQARAGGAKAVLATARKIAERVYRLLKYGQAYERQAMAAYEEAYRNRLVKALARKAEELGYRLTPPTESTPVTP